MIIVAAVLRQPRVYEGFIDIVLTGFDEKI
jgi:hypothetical protein